MKKKLWLNVILKRIKKNAHVLMNPAPEKENVVNAYFTTGKEVNCPVVCSLLRQKEHTIGVLNILSLYLKSK